MNLLRYLWRESPALLLAATGLALASGLSGAALVGVIGKGIGGSAPTLALAAGFFALCLLFVGTQTASEVALLHLTQNAICRLRIRLSAKILGTPTRTLQALGRHGLLAVLTKDIDVFVQSFNLIPLAFGNAILIVACFGYLAWVSWPLFLVLSACLAVGLVSFHFAEQRPLSLLRAARELVDGLYLNFRNLVDGARDLQLNARKAEAFVDQVIAPGAEHYRKAFVRSNVGYALVLNVGSVMFYLVIGFMLFVVPMWLPQPAGTLTVVTMILLYLVRPISDLMVALPTLRQAGIALARIQQLDGQLQAQPLRLQGPNPFAASQPLVIEFDGVVHTYVSADDDRHFRLGPVQLKLRQGEILFVIGGNGSGKTTLAMLLLGLYRPEAGVVRLNGVPVDDHNIGHYRQHFSAVLSDFHLFEQLLIDGPEVGERAAHYIRALRMEHKVRVANGRFSTIELSAGQRKRLALVSAYLEDRPVVLFDEWAADQDPVFKRIFYTELLPELKARGKAVVVISHDDAYFDHADRIVRIEDGRLTQVSQRHGAASPAAAAAPAEKETT